MPKWLGTLVLLSIFKIGTKKNCEILVDFAQLDPDPDDQNRYGSGSETLAGTQLKNGGEGPVQ